ncbi:hypothetical protein, partial [Enterococcus faecalis]|uniref:hypothetical protein n=1 Tax=Enterococcus faecalis TaxID=1351 RepID=UPI00207C3416
DFGMMPESSASQFSLPFARVAERVRPDRALNNRAVYRKYWWRYGEARPELRKAVECLSEVLAIVRVSRTVMVARVPT